MVGKRVPMFTLFDELIICLLDGRGMAFLMGRGGRRLRWANETLEHAFVNSVKCEIGDNNGWDFGNLV
jgi:hypothetical protein